LPVTAYDLGVEGHVFPEVEGGADFVEVFPDVG
jgi:hypothetical protein